MTQSPATSSRKNECLDSIKLDFSLWTIFYKLPCFVFFFLKKVLRGCRDEELKYLKFVQDVTTDVLDRGIFTNRYVTTAARFEPI